MSRAKIIVGVSLALFFVLSILLVHHLGSKRIIVREVAPNGIEFCIIQSLGDPFNTSAFYRKPGGAWNWFYFDHEDNYWNSAPTEVDSRNRLIKVFRRNKVAAAFNWDTEVFTKGTDSQTAEQKAAVPVGKNPWDEY